MEQHQQRDASRGDQQRAQLRIAISDVGPALVTLATEVAAAGATLLSYGIVPRAASDGRGHRGTDRDCARVWAGRRSTSPARRTWRRSYARCGTCRRWTRWRRYRRPRVSARGMKALCEVRRGGMYM